jgi:peptidyl-prolyl cis-trans isomerase C
MANKTSLSRPLLSLGLSLLLAGWVACKPDSGQPEAAATDAGTGTTATTQPGQTPAAGGQTAPGPAGSTASAQTPADPADAKVMDAKDLPERVAKVNGQDIKKQDLLQGAQAVQMRLAQEGRPVTPSVGFYRRVLDQVIGVTLLQQDAKAQGMTASDQEIQQLLAQRKRVFPNEEAFKQALAKASMTEAKLREQIRDEIAVQKYLQSQLANAADVTDQATRAFYDQNKKQMEAPERVHVRHILVRAEQSAPAADKEKARQKTEALLKRLQGGEDFAKLAGENSDDPGTKVRGGDLGWITKGQMVPPFDQASFALTKPNELSPVVESQFGYHIIQFLERQPAGTLPYEQVKDRIGQLLKEQQAQQKIANRVRELREKAKVEVFL